MCPHGNRDLWVRRARHVDDASRPKGLWCGDDKKACLRDARSLQNVGPRRVAANPEQAALAEVFDDALLLLDDHMWNVRAQQRLGDCRSDTAVADEHDVV